MLGFKVEQFDGIQESDFLAFQEHKWSSNRFNLERMKCRARLDALGSEWLEGLGEAAASLVQRTTLDHPHIFNGKKVEFCWTFLDRPTEEKERLGLFLDKDRSLQEKVGDPIPEHHLAVLGFGLNAHEASLFFRIHSHALLDKRNFLARVSDPLERPTFSSLMSKLSENFVIRFGEEVLEDAASSDGMDRFIEKLKQLDGWFTVEYVLPKDSPILTSPELVEWLKEHTPPLLSLWHFAVWSTDNDRLQLARKIKLEKKTQAKRMSGFQKGDSVRITGGLLAGKDGSVLDVNAKGRVKVQIGRMSIDMDPKLLKKG